MIDRRCGQLSHSAHPGRSPGRKSVARRWTDDIQASAEHQLRARTSGLLPSKDEVDLRSANPVLLPLPVAPQTIRAASVGRLAGGYKSRSDFRDNRAGAPDCGRYGRAGRHASTMRKPPRDSEIGQKPGSAALRHALFPSDGRVISAIRMSPPCALGPSHDYRRTMIPSAIA